MAVVLAVAAPTTGIVDAPNCEGKDLSEISPARPGGTHLGQMHPNRSDFYRGSAERHGWDSCTIRAADRCTVAPATLGLADH
ncbi:MAG: hypothetical protein OXG72_06425, partial [Acidobacteria bacterium]|nr:hypothetical protein [Acidobacteriota bacterium]